MGACGQDPRGRPHGRRMRADGLAMGPGARPDARMHIRLHGPGGALGAHGQHRRARRHGDHAPALRRGDLAASCRPRRSWTRTWCAVRIGYAEYPLYRYSGCVVAQPDMLYDACITGEPYPLKAGWWQSTNPLACCSQAPESKAYRALMSLDFNVVVDLFMTPTAMACAEVVLPVATWAEKTGLRSIWYYMQPINAAVDSSAIDVRSDLQINLDLGKRWAPEKWPWDAGGGVSSDQMGSTGRTLRAAAGGELDVSPVRIPPSTAPADSRPMASRASTRPPGGWSSSRPCASSGGSRRCPATTRPTAARFRRPRR